MERLLIMKSHSVFFSIHAIEDKTIYTTNEAELTLDKVVFRETQKLISENANRNKDFFDLETKVQSQRAIKDLEKKRSEKRRNLFETQDDIDYRKENLLNEIERRLKQEVKTTELFTIKWKMI